MKKFNILFVILLFAFACSAPKEETESTDAEAPTEEESVFSYSGSFEMGDQANVDMIRNLIDAYAEKDWEAVGSMMADSLTFYFSDGGVFSGTREQLLEGTEEYMKDVSIDVTYLASMAVNETTNDHKWALFWTAETHTDGDGEVTTEILQESFLIEDGKLTSMRQFKAEPNAADGPGGNNDTSDYTYSGSFAMADPSMVDVVIGLNDAAQSKDMTGIENAFADSVTIIGHDGFYFNATRDSLMNMVTEWFASIQEMNIDYNAGIAVTATDRNEDWVLLWYEDSSTNTEGENYHSFGHDDYLIVDGKIRVIRGYQMKIKEEGEEEASEEVSEETAQLVE